MEDFSGDDEAGFGLFVVPLDGGFEGEGEVEVELEEVVVDELDEEVEDVGLVLVVVDEDVGLAVVVVEDVGLALVVVEDVGLALVVVEDEELPLVVLDVEDEELVLVMLDDEDELEVGVQVIVSAATGLLVCSLSADSGVPGGTSTLNVSVAPLTSVTVTVHESASAPGTAARANTTSIEPASVSTARSLRLSFTPVVPFQAPSVCAFRASNSDACGCAQARYRLVWRFAIRKPEHGQPPRNSVPARMRTEH